MDDYLKLYQEVSPLIKIIQDILKHLNLPYSCSLILSTLILLQIGVTFKDIITLTGYTKSTVSTCLNILDKISMVSKVKKGRKYLYRTKVDLPELLLLKQKSMLTNEIEPLRNKIDAIISEREIKGEISERLRQLSAKLKILSTHLHQLIKSCEDKNYEENQFQ
ncbi:MAG: BlaI/MecI/CopY family transcriptional regulator [Sulfolobales archaeon]